MTCFCGCLCELHCTITCFFLKRWKKIREIACLLLSFGAGTNLFALLFGDSVIFFLWFKMLKFLWIYFTATKNLKKRKTPGKMWFYNPQRDQSQNTTFLKRDTIISKYRKSNMFNTVYWFSYHLFFSNHNEKISVLSS